MFMRSADGKTLAIVIRQLVDYYRVGTSPPAHLELQLGDGSHMSVLDALEELLNDYEAAQPIIVPKHDPRT